MNKLEYTIRTTLQRDPKLSAEVELIKKHSKNRKDFGRWMYDYFISHEKDVFSGLKQEDLESIHWINLFDLIYKEG